MRYRLIELLNFVQCKAECCSALDGGRCGDLDRLDRCQIEAIADHLLANGIIVPPCKVGDKVYIVKCYTNSYLEIVSREVIPTLVKEIIVNENGISIMTEEAEYTAEHIGEFVFLTREEAEQALATDTNVGSKKEREKV